MENYRELVTEEEIKIFSNPYHLKIVDIFSRQKAPLTVKEVADLMNEAPSKVHYHVMKLLSIHILTLDHTVLIKGITAKYYRLTAHRFKVNTPFGNHVDLDTYDHVVNSILSFVEEYRQDLVNISLYNKSMPKEEPSNLLQGFISKEDVYLNKAELKAFKNDLYQLIRKYENHERSGQNRYNVMLAAFKDER